MKIYDITQEIFTGKVYPGDLAPSYRRVMEIAQGAPCNLTEFQMGAHNATHLDAPCHFYKDGKTVDQMDLSRCIGPCTVIEIPKDPERLEQKLKTCQKRLLLKGTLNVTIEMAKLFNQYGMLLIGVELQSVGPEGSPMQVHLELLGTETVILEGLVLKEVDEGDYFLSAAPIKLGGSDGAPCRAILLKSDEFTCIK